LTRKYINRISTVCYNNLDFMVIISKCGWLKPNQIK